MKKRIVLKSSILALVAGMTVMVGSAQADQVDVQILGVNDFHGAIDQTGSAYMPEGKVAGAGTAAQLDAYMDKAQKDFTDQSKTPEATSIRVQAGDMVGASPADSGLLQDEPTVQVFNEMNFEYGTLGNHEFDEGLAEYNRIMTGQAPAPDSTINDITKNYNHVPSKQTIVISNVVDKESGQIPYGWQPYAIKNIPVNNTSVNIGFIGIVTSEIPNLVLRQNYQQYNFLDEAETIAKYAKELRAKNVNAIVVLAHVPATSDKEGRVGEEIATIINKVNKLYPDNSVDIVFAGHNHQYTNGTIGKTRVVQALSQGKAYADVRGKLDTDTQDFIDTPSAQVLAVAPGLLKGSSEIQTMVDQAKTIVAQVTEAKIGQATTPDTISRQVNDNKESAVGNLITKAQLTVAKETYPDIDFAITNDGGIRSDLLVKADKTITWGSAQAVQPFGNILQVVEMTGQDIYDALNEQYDEGEKYFLQMSGLKYTYTDNDLADPLKPFKVVKIYKDNGQEIDPKASYKLVINDFLYGGGDGFASFRKAKLLGAINPDTEVFIKYIKDLEAKNEPVSANLSGVKTYVTAVLESSTSQDSQGRHDIIKRLYRDKQGKIIFVETLSDLFTPFNKLTVSPQVNASKADSTTSTTDDQVSLQKDATKKELPRTGSEENTSLIMSLLGMISLSAVRVIKKKTLSSNKTTRY
ncbi:bifunctional metallophosphatase/5'-nucleotidase [Streptococcus didelphis]|uniref:Bifunctional metallophosphatase/5'-nucleotidase n=1 Tax=Streptococcus didelphis TaxID=102886 RepID=A0ABY9LHJ9_9STRE|nr:bifunctional metallophosphatase/5'-nucleotidase [Streptococcus didelphis]WMB28323.1 bifunctional metallophosphatase/5'-nucleotidase [Streptococcus didelphis]